LVVLDDESHLMPLDVTVVVPFAKPSRAVGTTSQPAQDTAPAHLLQAGRAKNTSALRPAECRTAT
jgi:hypothetical protein